MYIYIYIYGYNMLIVDVYVNVLHMYVETYIGLYEYDMVL